MERKQDLSFLKEFRKQNRIAQSYYDCGYNKEQEDLNRYRKALEEIEGYINNQGIDNKWNMRIQRFRSGILDIINKAKGEGEWRYD